MLTTEKLLPLPTNELVLSFDLEWTKNYRVPNGNKPFCFSFVYFAPSVKLSALEELEFGFISNYAEHEREIPRLVRAADQILGRFMQNHLVVVGHQLSSDLSVLLRYDPNSHFHSLAGLRQAWKDRRRLEADGMLAVFDTRYDLNSLLMGKSRRLVDVCVECRLGVTQPEIKSSMTKMQNDYYLTQDKRTIERLSVLNIRHSLSAAMLYLCFRHDHKPARGLNVNKIIYDNLQNYYNYVREVSSQ